MSRTFIEILDDMQSLYEELQTKIFNEVVCGDKVDVVRCKDCLMTKERDEYTNTVWCCRHREYIDDTYYCADGLRRGNDEDGKQKYL